MKRVKRFLALLLTMVMLFSLFPTSAFAEEGEVGEGTDAPSEDSAVIEQEPDSENVNELAPETGFIAAGEEYDGETPDEAGDNESTEAPNAMLEFVLQPEDGVIREGENYVVSWELNFAPTRQELLREEYGEDETPQWTLVEELPADACSWELETPGVYCISAWQGDTCVLSEVFTVEVEAERVVEESIAVAEAPGDATPDKVVGKPEEDEIMAYSGTCGDNLTWTLSDNGVLTISGSGSMTNWSINSFAPWYSYRRSITEIVLPGALTQIGDYAFYECYNLTSVIIPSGVTSIGDYSYYKCSSLTSVTIPSGVTSIGERAFRDCRSLTSVTIPEGVNSIGSEAFSDCQSLISVAIASTVTSIVGAPFARCKALTEILVSEENKAFRMEDGILYDIELTRLIQCPSSRSGDVTIPSSVTVIENCDRHWELCVPRLQWADERDDPGERDRHWNECVPRLQRADERDDPVQRDQHRELCVLPLQRADECDNPVQRDQHRKLCVLRLQRADERYDPVQRDQHRELCVLRLQWSEDCSLPRRRADLR